MHDHATRWGAGGALVLKPCSRLRRKRRTHEAAVGWSRLVTGWGVVEMEFVRNWWQC